MFRFKLVPKNGKGGEFFCRQPYGSRYVWGVREDGVERLCEVRKFRIVRL